MSRWLTKTTDRIGRSASKVVDRLVRREPVLFFGVIGMWIGLAASIDPDSRAGLALAATVLLFQRAYSTPKAAAEQRVAEAATGARNEALADVASLKPKPARARKAAK